MTILLYMVFNASFCPYFDLKSLDFAYTLFLTKLFRTVNRYATCDCCKFLQFTLSSNYLATKYEKLIMLYI